MRALAIGFHRFGGEIIVRRLVGTIAVSTLLVLAAATAAQAEIFVLTGGGRVEGEILNPDQSPRESYTIRTSHGARITLDVSQVEEVLHLRPEEAEYEKIRHRYPDTVEGHWAMAEWCRQRQMLSAREKHLRRLLELDPDHEKARRALGYTRVGETWMTHDERMLEQGYQRYKGRWRLPQEIELMEKQRQKETAEGEWKRDVNMWREWLYTDRHRIAQEKILAIDDPNAVKALAYALKEDSRDRARLLYVEALSGIGGPKANRILARLAMQDPVEEVRLTCLDYLSERQDREAVEYFIGRLESENNAEINRAAQALRHMQDATTVAPLINALVTVHKYKITTGSPGQTSTTFSNAGPGGLSVGSQTRVVTQRKQNREVLDALVALTEGINFGFDVARWKAWYSTQITRPNLDARRD